MACYLRAVRKTLALRFAVGLAVTVSAVGCVRAATRPRAHKAARKRAPHEAQHADKADCVATYNNKCFADADDACAYAGCADQRCEVLPTVPAHVSCADLR